MVSILKLLILPGIMFCIFKLVGITGTLITACMISASVPSATNTVMFSAKYDRNTGLASQTVAVVSFISIITLPVMIALAQSVG